MKYTDQEDEIEALRVTLEECAEATNLQHDGLPLRSVVLTVRQMQSDLAERLRLSDGYQRRIAELQGELADRDRAIEGFEKREEIRTRARARLEVPAGVVRTLDLGSPHPASLRQPVDGPVTFAEVADRARARIIEHQGRSGVEARAVSEGALLALRALSQAFAELGW